MKGTNDVLWPFSNLAWFWTHDLLLANDAACLSIIMTLGCKGHQRCNLAWFWTHALLTGNDVACLSTIIKHRCKGHQRCCMNCFSDMFEGWCISQTLTCTDGLCFHCKQLVKNYMTFSFSVDKLNRVWGCLTVCVCKTGCTCICVCYRFTQYKLHLKIPIHRDLKAL